MSDETDHHDADGPAIEAEKVEPPETDDNRSLVPPDANLPHTVLALPLNQRPVFPTMMMPLVIPPGRLGETVKFAAEKREGYVGFFLTRRPLEEGGEYTFEDLYPVGTIARLHKVQDHQSGGVQVLIQVLSRFVIEEQIADDPFVLVCGSHIKSVVDAEDEQIRAYTMAIVTALKDLVQHNPVFADEIRMVLANYNNIDGPGRLADLAASLTTASREDIQEVLETFEVLPRMEKVLALLAKEQQVAELKSKIQEQINTRINEHQRKFFLHEQLKAIKEELGLEKDEKALELEEFRQRFEAKRARMSDEVRETCESELQKLGLLDPSSSEFGVSRNRLDWLLGMPWGELTEDVLDPVALRTGLDVDHYGLEEVKDRIVEFCAVRRLRNDRGGGIIALVGPPGTGKTSVGASIARHMNRAFSRFSLGGLRDEAEIKGHRRTYIGALPGKLAQSLRRCGTMNPVILLDEVDKLSHGIQGDPSSALLEVLDPEQNKEFLDHYLDVRVDLSQVLFICTANDVSTIPEPLHDRMEIIRLAGYVDQEKLVISDKYLVPKQRKAHGLKVRDINFHKSALRKLVRGYAREAGVRQAEQLVAKICRKVARAKAEHETAEADTPFAKVTVRDDNLADYLGKPRMSDDELIATATPGVVTGLAWTAMGGATLEVEAVAIEADKSGFTLSGQLGDVMKESAGLARSYLRAHAREYGLDPAWFDRHLIHMHVPAGATPKDGPSAGITMATAMLSLALDKPVKRKLGMTGELTLTGRVYPIGGVREKLVAAKRSRLKTVILPRANERDYAELPDHLRTGLEVHFAEHVDEVVRLAGLL